MVCSVQEAHLHIRAYGKLNILKQKEMQCQFPATNEVESDDKTSKFIM